jgi:hypothetical protein
MPATAGILLLALFSKISFLEPVTIKLWPAFDQPADQNVRNSG